MTPEGAKLHRFLGNTIEWLGGGMPEVGGKKLADDLRIAMPDLRKVADDLRMRAAAAATMFISEARNVEKAIKNVEYEADEMRKVANEMLGNNPPEEAPE